MTDAPQPRAYLAPPADHPFWDLLDNPTTEDAWTDLWSRIKVAYPEVRLRVEQNGRGLQVDMIGYTVLIPLVFNGAPCSTFDEVAEIMAAARSVM